MKKLFFFIALSAGVSAFAQYNLPAASPRQTIEQQFSVSKVSLDYGRPSVNNRKIFGALVPYGEVWRAGANSATKITFGQPVKVGNTVLPPGSYAVFVIPQATSWRVLFNKEAEQWGAYNYKADLNVAEITVPVQKLMPAQEVLTWLLTPSGNQIQLSCMWADVRVDVPITVADTKTTDRIIEKLTEIRTIEKEASKK